jgi:acetylornithine/N-succinyldiaminopimelate aminotransferase
MNQRELFLRHVAQTSPSPLGIQIESAEGLYLCDPGGKKYLDLIGGISVCNTGHRHPKVVEAIIAQANKYLHVLVYGEMIESPQVDYATLLTRHLPVGLNSVYFTNSGAEAVEGAMKLAKRATNRTQIIAFKNSYHGSTQGALSVMGDEYWRNAYRPLLPDILHLDYNSFAALDQITERTACVIAETIQAEMGVNPGNAQWLKALGAKCRDCGALLILDEVQTGFGRTGALWSFESFDIVPDILVLGKALGGGLPLGAFIADINLMVALSGQPVLGHITTFGGHPLSCAAGMASLKLLLEENWIGLVQAKEKLFKKLMVHPKIKAVRTAGLLIAVEFHDAQSAKSAIDSCLHATDDPEISGNTINLLTDWFLFAPQCMRIAPPLTITEEEIQQACAVILSSLKH